MDNPKSSQGPSFAAIDFETADYGRDSACALAIVRVHGDRIVSASSHLIRPPRKRMIFTYLHGISWSHVADKPTFGELWPRILSDLDGANFLVAHNASFDRSVLGACCAAAGLAPPPLEFHCTVQVARHSLGLHPANLPYVCEQLGIPLRHHDALSDARACAQIYLRALQEGCALPSFLGPPTRAFQRPAPRPWLPRRTSILPPAPLPPPSPGARAPAGTDLSTLPSPLQANPEENGDEPLLTSREVAMLLDMSPDDVVLLARSNRIQGVKSGRRWRFTMSAVEAARTGRRG